MVNGITELHMMKLDVLTALDEIKVCTNYIVDNSITDQVPYDLSEVQNLEYKSFGGWYGEDITDCTFMYDLPIECQDYIEFIEKYLGIPISLVSVGPDRSQVIVEY